MEYTRPGNNGLIVSWLAFGSEPSGACRRGARKACLPAAMYLRRSREQIRGPTRDNISARADRSALFLRGKAAVNAEIEKSYELSGSWLGGIVTMRLAQCLP